MSNRLLLGLVKTTKLIRKMIISIFDVLCFKQHLREVLLQAVRDPGSENQSDFGVTGSKRLEVNA